MPESPDLAITILLLSGLMLLACSSAICLKKVRFPYTIGLVLLGMLLALAARHSGYLQLIFSIKFNHDLIMYVLLPVLIFDAALHIKLPHLRRELVPVLTLAIPGVLLSMLIVGFSLSAFSPLTLAGALLFGALISATDPVAVIALFKEVGAPERMSMLMDSESLFNDATAIVIFSIALAVIQSGSGINAMVLIKGLWSFMLVFFGGIMVGVVLGLCTHRLLWFGREEPFVQIAYSTILAYTSFIIADHVFGVSGVMATVAAGLVIRHALTCVICDQVRQFVKPYWEFMAFVANSLIFLLLGVKEDLLLKNLDRLFDIFPYLVLAIGVVLLARFIVVFTLLPLSEQLPAGRVVDHKIKAIMFWGGLRGVVPVALVLLIPASMEQYRLIVDMTLAVILFSLVVQGTTINWLMGKLKVNQQYHIVRAAMKKLGA